MRLNHILRRCILLLCIILVSGWLNACGDATSSIPSVGPSGKIKAVATTSLVADLVKNVAGDQIELTTLMQPDIDQHNFQPTKADLQTIATAQILFLNGAGLEGWVDEAIKNSDFKGLKIDTAKSVILHDLQHTNHAHEFGDPHVSQDPENAMLMVAAIADGMATLDPANSTLYRKNARLYRQQLENLTREIQSLVNDVPSKQRQLVTTHAAFGYWADRFGYRIVATVWPELSRQVGPSLQHLKEVQQSVQALPRPVIFTEPDTDTKLLDQIKRAGQVQSFVTLYTDNLGPGGGEADTYIKMMRYNARAIANALKP